MCRDKFKKIVEKKDLLHTIPPEVWEKGWNVNIQSVGSGRNTIKYLSRYVFKVAISDHRIIKVHNRRVYFKYTNRETSRVIITSLDVIDFIEGFNSVMNKAVKEVPEKVYLSCPSCGKPMKFMFSILPNNARIRGSGFT